jgi:hypothetical protein
MTKRRERIVGAVVAALAAGATVVGAYVSVAGKEGASVDDVSAETHAAIVEGAVVLRDRGVPVEEAVSIVVARTGAPAEAIAPYVRAAYGESRVTSARRTETVAVLVPVADPAPVWAAIADAVCAPLRLAGEATDVYTSCIHDNDVEQGAQLCDDKGEPAGWIVRTHATPADAARWLLVPGAVSGDGVVEIERVGWVPCPASR